MVQLIVASFSLPVLAFWQMDISLLSLAGNLLFGPILIIVLLLCSLIFFAQICMIPHSALDLVLQRVLDIWLSIMSVADNRWLVVYAGKPWHLLLIFPACILLLFFLWRRNNKVLIVLSSFAALHLLQICILLLTR